MSENWAEAIADRMAGTGSPLKGRLLLLGAAYALDFRALTVRTTCGMTAENTVGRLVGLADVAGQDIAIGVVEQWRQEKAKGTIRAPELDVQRIRCLTMGDARIAAPSGWS